MSNEKKSRNAKIIAARDLLDLGKSATLEEIKKAYRKKAKENHPDTADLDHKDNIAMHALTEAYQTLLDYCAGYRFPLKPEELEPDDEDWWMNRFGDDPLWGKKKG